MRAVDQQKLEAARNAVLDKIAETAKDGDADDAELARDLAEAIALLEGHVSST